MRQGKVKNQCECRLAMSFFAHRDHKTQWHACAGELGLRNSGEKLAQGADEAIQVSGRRTCQVVPERKGRIAHTVSVSLERGDPIALYLGGCPTTCFS